MKRTRRIEITRYSRRVTLIQGGDATAEPASKSSAIEAIANVREVVATALEEPNEGQLIRSESATVQVSRQRPFHNLRHWLRRRL